MTKLITSTSLFSEYMMNEPSYLEQLHALEKRGVEVWIKYLCNKLGEQANILQVSLWQRIPRKKYFEQIDFQAEETEKKTINFEIIEGFVDSTCLIQTLALENVQKMNLEFQQENDSTYYFLPFVFKNVLQHFIIIAYNPTSSDEVLITGERLNHLKTCYENASEMDFLQKQSHNLQAQINALESSQMAIHENAVGFMKVHKQLTDSIQYAKKMQEAILPKEHTLANIFDEQFVIYLPKDIVSGDFYWLAQIDYTFLGVIDCTGHGVPGAFMSMIANTLLSEIVCVKRINDPATILSLLHTGVRNALRQTETNNVDGMDVCLIRLERDEDFQLHLTFAGAKRPLYFIRDNNLFKIKGDRENIGGWGEDKKFSFKNHHLKLRTGDILYLTTDGFVDAPNAKRKSFGNTHFKETIVQNAHLPLSEQKKLLENALFEHQKDTQQRDDITVVAIKV